MRGKLAVTATPLREPLVVCIFRDDTYKVYRDKKDVGRMEVGEKESVR
jgi:hypothetical protein